MKYYPSPRTERQGPQHERFPYGGFSRGGYHLFLPVPAWVSAVGVVLLALTAFVLLASFLASA